MDTITAWIDNRYTYYTHRHVMKKCFRCILCGSRQWQGFYPYSNDWGCGGCGESYYLIRPPGGTPTIHRLGHPDKPIPATRRINGKPRHVLIVTRDNHSTHD